MRNVYLVNLSFGLAGIERRFANIFHALRRRGHVRPILVVPDTLADALYAAGMARPDPDIWTIRELRTLRAMSALRHVPYVGSTLMGVVRSRPIAWAHRPIWERIARDGGAVVHIGLNCSALRPPPVPLVYECVDSTLTQLATRHYRRARSRPCVVSCQTGRIQSALEAAVGGPARWQTVVAPCCFADYVSAAPRKEPDLVAFVGRLSPEKQPWLFIDAVAAVRAAGIPVRAVMLGEGPLEAMLRSRIERLNLQSVVEMGFSSRPGEVLSKASVFVSLQMGDNYPSQALLEAMGAGCAVVATDVGDTARLVRPEAGTLVASDTAAVSRAIAALLRDPLSASAKGAAAAQFVRTEHSAERYAEFLESIYGRAVELFAAGSMTASPRLVPSNGPS